jgi:hypothetical protein
VLFPDGGNPGSNGSSQTSGCHDLTAYPTKDLMAGACMGDGIILDISDRAAPVVTEQVRDTENFAFWHSATFNNDATKVVFTDELGGGGAPTCNPTVGSTKGANGIYDLSRGGDLSFKSYYKIPRTQSNTENCVAHNGSLVPVKGKDVRLHRLGQPQGDRLVRSRSHRGRPTRDRRRVVDVLVQRPHLHQRDPAWLRRLHGRRSPDQGC